MINKKETVRFKIILRMFGKLFKFTKHRKARRLWVYKDLTILKCGIDTSSNISPST